MFIAQPRITSGINGTFKPCTVRVFCALHSQCIIAGSERTPFVCTAFAKHPPIRAHADPTYTPSGALHLLVAHMCS